MYHEKVEDRYGGPGSIFSNDDYTSEAWHRYPIVQGGILSQAGYTEVCLHPSRRFAVTTHPGTSLGVFRDEESEMFVRYAGPPCAEFKSNGACDLFEQGTAEDRQARVRRLDAEEQATRERLELARVYAAARAAATGEAGLVFCARCRSPVPSGAGGAIGRNLFCDPCYSHATTAHPVTPAHKQRITGILALIVIATLLAGACLAWTGQ